MNSALLKHRLSSYISENFPKFIEFFEYYFDFIEESNLINNAEIKDAVDVDKASDRFLLKYLKEMSVDLPSINKISNQRLVKLAKLFYLSKGSTDSIEFYFKIVFDSDVEVGYPRDNILKTSYNRFNQNILCYVSCDDELFNYILSLKKDQFVSISNGVNTDYTFNSASIFNNGILEFNISSYDEDSLIPIDAPVNIMVNGDVVGTGVLLSTISGVNIVSGGNYYDSNTDIINIGDSSIITNIRHNKTGGFTDYTINAGGTDYALNEFVTLIGDGFGFLATITKVNDSTGAIEALRVDSSGYRYSKVPTVILHSENGIGADINVFGDDVGSIDRIILDNTIVNAQSTPAINIISEDGVNGVLELIKSTVFKTPKSPSNEVYKILDSDFYQQFSFTIKGDTQLVDFQDSIDKRLKPAGSKIFSIYSTASVAQFDAVEPISSLPIIVDLIGIANTIQVTQAATQRSLIYVANGLPELFYGIDQLEVDKEFIEHGVSEYYGDVILTDNTVNRGVHSEIVIT